MTDQDTRLGDGEKVFPPRDVKAGRMLAAFFKILLEEVVKEGASDVHFGRFSGVHIRQSGDLLRLENGGDDASGVIKSGLDYLATGEDYGYHLALGLVHLISSEGETSKTGNLVVIRELYHACSHLRSGNPLPADVNLVFRLGGALGGWRLSLYNTDLENIALSLRALPSKIPVLSKLLPQPLLALESRLQEVVTRREGIVLVTGVTGSGKSSTMAALIDYINQNYPWKIVTLEDPVEYWHDSEMSVIHHRDIGTDTPSFSEGVKGALRQDPDVIYIGEMRDLDTIARALTAAETGHLVLATLHARDVRGTITRMVEVFEPEQHPMIRTQLANSLQCVISQTLKPAVSEYCLQGRVLHPEVAIFPKGEGGPRTAIQEGRYHQVKQSLETMGENGGGAYYSSAWTLKALQNAGLVAK